MTTGWPPGLLQDDSRKLSDWFASRVDARWTVRQVCVEIERNRMTDKQPEALALADALLDGMSDEHWNQLSADAAEMLRTQHAEIERLNAVIKWEQNRAERIGTHGPGCEKWGPAHYECALRAIERKDALLRQALDMLRSADAGFAVHPSIFSAITKELSQ